MSRITVFNTGRLYMKGGQPIAWVRLTQDDLAEYGEWFEPPEGQDWVLFVDFARGIDQVISLDKLDYFGEPIPQSEANSMVLSAYDNYNYDRGNMPSPYAIKQELKQEMEKACSESLD